ncbi:MAG: DUF1232 domain-containing protein [Chloroflexi bacterium]|nr:DUF1232 domain-containing protein [Chloroflexota bacterium]
MGYQSYRWLWFLPQLFRNGRLVFRLLRDKRVPGAVKLIIPAMLLYVISPIDLVPDFLLGLGYLDDIAVLLLGFRLFIAFSPRRVVEEHLREIYGPPVAAKDKEKGSYIETSYQVMKEDKG